MSLSAYIAAMPKAELHVHLEGSIRPETLLALAERHGVALPAHTLPELQEWYTFTGFPHFVQIYYTIAECLRTPEDIELIAREFLLGQAAQNIRYSEVTYTPYTHFAQKGMPFHEQLAALNRARAWAVKTLGVRMGIVLDIDRAMPGEDSPKVADWAISAMGEGVVALGLGGDEQGNPPEKHRAAFERARAAGLPAVPHAGETAGPASIWGALRELHAVRIGHGVRCVEDPALVRELHARQTPLEVCPSSNVCLGVAPSLPSHQLPAMLDAGLLVTLGSDDPPMFNTTLTREYQLVAEQFGLGADRIEQLALNGVRASLLPPAERAALETTFAADFVRLRAEHGLA